MRTTTLDWGIGRYETIAAQLSPAAEIVVATAELKRGDRVVDIGCGTGNAALLAAKRGAEVIGVDPASRLIDVATERAAREEVQASFRPGEAASLPIPDASVDVAMSVFGIIFAADAAAAAAELDRVLASRARIVLSAWLPIGAVYEMNAAGAAAVRAAVGAPAEFNWHDPNELTRLLQPYGFTLSTEEHELAFTATSARDFFEELSRDHPLAVSGLGLLAKFGKAEQVRGELLEILEKGNEDTTAFRSTGRYVVAVANR
jgi:SAM-dependent methyltransferase